MQKIYIIFKANNGIFSFDFGVKHDLDVLVKFIYLVTI